MQNLTRSHLFRSACALGAFAAALGASAQFNVGTGFYQQAVGITINTPSGPIVLKIGDQIQLPNGSIITIGPETMLQSGTKITVGGQPGLVPFVDQRELSIYYAGFSVAGQVPNSSGGFSGGTQEVRGLVVSANMPFTMNPDKGQSSSFGGWYMFPLEGGPGIYQMHARYFLTPNVGVQLAYLNSSKGDSPAASAYGIWRLNSANVDPNASQPWGMEIGVGAFNDFADARDPVTLATIRRNSINFSAFGQASLKIAKQTSLVGSYWYVRSRQLDWTRFGLGLAFKF